MNWPDRAGLDRAGGMLERWRQKREKTSDFKLQLLLQGLAENKAAEELEKSRDYDLETYEAQQKAQREASELLHTQQAAKNLIEYTRRRTELSDDRGRRKEEGDAAELLAREKQAWQSGVTQMSDAEYAEARRLGFPGRGWENQVENMGPVMDQVRANFKRQKLMEDEELRVSRSQGQSPVDVMIGSFMDTGDSREEAQEKAAELVRRQNLTPYQKQIEGLMEAGYTEPEAKESIARKLRGADFNAKQDMVSQLLDMKLTPREFPGIDTPGNPALYRAYQKYAPQLLGRNIPALTQRKLEARTTPENFPREDALKTEFGVTNVFQLFDNQRMRNLDPEKDHVAARAEVIKTVLPEEFSEFSQGISNMQLMVQALLSESQDPMGNPLRYTLGTLAALTSDKNEQYRLFSWIVNARLYPEGKGQAAPAVNLEDM